ncbi:MAG: hypothetical protein H6645_08190 [Caldilineaceae bacterium]|nr:hypothetical protein [Caldilineaceae bacterium]
MSNPVTLTPNQEPTTEASNGDAVRPDRWLAMPTTTPPSISASTPMSIGNCAWKMWMATARQRWREPGF